MLNVTNGHLYLSFGDIDNGLLSLNNQARSSVNLVDGTLQIIGRSIYMSKLERNRHIIIASYDATNWEAIGVDIDDLSKELNPDTETGKNVLCETTFRHNGYEPEVDVSPYYADPTSKLYEGLRDAALYEKYGDADIKGYYVEAIFEDDAVNGVLTSTSAVKREAYIVPQSIGGDTSGYQIPFTITPVGTPEDVTVTYTKSTRAVTVTAKSGG